MTSSRISSFIFSMLFCCTFATSDSDQYRIVGGYRPKEHTLAKHLVSLRIRKFEDKLGYGSGHFCGGSILSPKVILTAGHCVKDKNGKRYKPENIFVVAGSPQRLIQENTSQLIDVIKIRMHGGYVFTGFRVKNDIALLHLATDIIEDGITAQRIPMADEKIASDTTCTAIGWGNIVHRGSKPGEVIYVDLDIMSNTKCRRRSGGSPLLHIINFNSFIVRRTTICVADRSDKSLHKGSCQGDSGGPLFCNSQLVGITSGGVGRCGDNPSIYTSVFHFRDWIENCAIQLDVSHVWVSIIMTAVN